MTETKPSPSETGLSQSGRRFGYSVAVLVNAALLFVVNNVLAWDVLPFLTEDFERVIPILSVSLGASILANLMYLFYDEAWFKSLSQIVLLGISMAATVRIYQVFPFDFSEYEFGWATVARVLLILGMVGMGIGIVAEVVKFVVRASKS